MNILNISPIPASRPRFSKYGTYNTSKYSNYKKSLSIMLKQIHKTQIENQCRLTIKFYLPIPKMSKKKTEEHIGMYHYKKPDLDNLLKGFMDAANGIVYKDDNIVSSIIAEKYYCDKPRIEYSVMEL